MKYIPKQGMSEQKLVDTLIEIRGIVYNELEFNTPTSKIRIAIDQAVKKHKK